VDGGGGVWDDAAQARTSNKRAAMKVTGDFIPDRAPCLVRHARLSALRVAD
jgi:hypothetical protein